MIAYVSENLRRYVDEGFEKLKPSSRQSKMARLQFFKNTPIDVVLMKQFDARVVDDWISWLLRHPSRKNPGRKSFCYELMTLVAILNWYRNYFDPSFVVPVIKRHRERVRYKAISNRRPDYFMKPEDVVNWVSWLKEHRTNSVYWQLATFLVLTGVRIGEACGLEWEAIDLEAKIANVRKTVMWDHWTRKPTLVDSTKTQESTRIIPLATELVDMLSTMKREAGKCKMVFKDESGSYCVTTQFSHHSIKAL